MNRESQESSYDFPINEAPVQMGDDAHQELEDGSSNVYFNYSPQADQQQDIPFNANLAMHLTDQQLQSVSSYIFQAIQSDKDSREQWETRVAASMDLLGLKTEKKDFPFQDAPNVVSSVFMQSLLEAASVLYTETLPPSGPAKMEIVGDAIPEREDKSNRIEKWMNFYCTQLDRSFYTEIKLAETWSPFIGSAFVKVYRDPVLNRPVVKFVKPQDGIVNYGVSTLDTATRFTYQFTLSGKEVKERQIAGIYKDQHLVPQDDIMNNQSEIKEKLDSIEGFQSIGVEYNQKYALYECYTEYNLPGFEDVDGEGKFTGLPLPYIFTFDIDSQKILAIYRNWEEGDPNFEAKQHFVHFKYWQGLGFYGLGLAQVCGSNATAATQAINQFATSAIFSNFSGGVRAKGVRFESNSLMAAPGEFVQVDIEGADDIRKVMMPFPTNGPSAALKEFKDDLEEDMRRLAGSGTQALPDFNPNAPVGTTLALLENAQKLQSSVVREAHRAMGEVLKLMFKIFSETLPEQPYPYQVGGNNSYIMRQDFTQDMNIIPVSDPNLTTSTQRLIRNEAIIGWAKENPDLFNIRALYASALREMKVMDVDKILRPEQQDQEVLPLDPITENQHAMQGMPLKAGLTQDHHAHMTVHQSIVQQMQDQQNDPSSLIAHIHEHEAMQYLLDMEQAIGQQLPEDPSKLSMEQQNQIAMQAARSVQGKQEEQQQQMPPPPIDPAIPMLEEVKVRAMGIEEKSKIDMEKLEIEKVRLQVEVQRLELDEKKLQVELEKIKLDNETKIQIERMKLELEALKAGESQSLKERQQQFNEAVKENEIINNSGVI